MIPKNTPAPAITADISFVALISILSNKVIIAGPALA